MRAGGRARGGADWERRKASENGVSAYLVKGKRKDKEVGKAKHSGTNEKRKTSKARAIAIVKKSTDGEPRRFSPPRRAEEKERRTKVIRSRVKKKKTKNI